jgi:hypothetical protein
MARDKGFRPHFDGPEVLNELLAIAGSEHDTEAVAERMREALREGQSHDRVIPQLFDGEPHFPDPDYARRLFENLLGLWELLEEGAPLPKGPRPAKVKPEKAKPPRPLEGKEPDAAFVESAWRHLDDEPRVRERLFHSFENRQDPLLERLDELALTDEGYGVLRLLLSELSAMIELGAQKPLRQVAPEALNEQEPQVPAALWAYAEEAIFEAEQDEEAPLEAKEAETVRTWAKRSLAALWRAGT